MSGITSPSGGPGVPGSKVKVIVTEMDGTVLDTMEVQGPAKSTITLSNVIRSAIEDELIVDGDES